MPQYQYAFQKFDKEHMARANGRDMAISTKQAIEICNYLRGRRLTQAKMLLEGVLEKKQAIPFKRFTDGVGHRSGKLASGRYPVKASRAVLKLLESAEANAQTKGLSTGDLEIIHICANKAHSPVHYGRHSGREFKRTHVEVVLQEKQQESKKENKKEAKKPQKAPEKKPQKAPEKKPEEKPAAPAQKTEEKPEVEEKPKPEPKKEEKKETPKEEPKAELKEEKKEENKEEPKEQPQADTNPEDKK